MAKGMVHSMMVFMSKRMIACDEASFLISLREDRKLDFKRWVQLKMHLISCNICRKYAKQIGELAHTMERYREACTDESCTHHLSPDAGSRIDKELASKLNAK